MTVSLITALYPSTYDTLHPLPPQDIDVDAVVVTDDPEFQAQGWRTHYLPRPGVHPNRAGKLPRCCPWLFTGAESSMWLDASYRILSRSFVSAHLRWAEPFAFFVHPNRDCLYTEATVSMKMEKYQGQPIEEQVALYREAGHPDHWGLWEANAIARHHTPAVKALGQVWLTHIEHYSFQDQISLPFILREMEMWPQTLPLELRRLAVNLPNVPNHNHAMVGQPRFVPSGATYLHG